MRSRHVLAVGVVLLSLAVAIACGGSSTQPAAELPAPELDSVAPARGPQAGGTVLTLVGANFSTDSGATTVQIGGVEASNVVVATETELTCVCPPGAEGAVDVRVETPSGEATLEDAFAYNPTPRVVSVVPNSGWVDASTPLDVRGFGFQDLDPGPTTVTVGGEALTDPVVLDDTWIQGTCPALAAGLVDVRIQNRNGEDTLADAFACFPYPLEFLTEDVVLDGAAAPAPISVQGGGGPPGGAGPDGRSDNAAIAASGARVYVAWREMRNGVADIHFNRSLDGGTTWLPADVRINRGGVGTDSANEVALACDGLYVVAVWADWREGSTNVYCNVSEDGGVTWGETDTRLSPSNGGSLPQVVLDGLRLHVVWRQGGSDVMYRRSEDRGDTWGDPVRLDGFGGQSDRPRLAVAASHVHVAWSDGFGVYHNLSVDDGSLWAGEERVDQGSLGTRGLVELAANGDYVFFAWQDFRDDPGDVYFRRYDAKARIWGPELLMDTDGAGQSMSGVPKIGCSNNVVYLAWRDWHVGPQGDVRFCQSSDSGANWSSPPQQLNRVAAGSQATLDMELACLGAHVYVVWTDMRNAPTSYSDIYLNYSRDHGQTWLAEDVRMNVGSTGAQANLAQVACDGAHAYIVWQDSRPGLSSDLDIRANASQP